VTRDLAEGAARRPYRMQILNLRRCVQPMASAASAAATGKKRTRGAVLGQFKVWTTRVGTAALRSTTAPASHPANFPLAVVTKKEERGKGEERKKRGKKKEKKRGRKRGKRKKGEKPSKM